MSHIKTLYEEISNYLAAGNTPAAFELVNQYKLNSPKEQIAAVRRVMKPTDKPIGSNSFRYRRLIIRQAHKKA